MSKRGLSLESVIFFGSTLMECPLSYTIILSDERDRSLYAHNTYYYGTCLETAQGG
jgi:hypothetical protein